MRWWGRAVGVLLVAGAGCGGLADLPARAIVGPFSGSIADQMAGQSGSGGADALPGDAEPLAVRAPDGIELRGFVVRSRAGPSRGLLVFLHGLGGRASDWAAAARDGSRAGFDVVAWDGRGHGRSGGRCTWGAREPGDLTAVLDALSARHLRVDRTVLFGYSMGAVVALSAAPLEHRVRAVVAVAPLIGLAEGVARVARSAPPNAVREALAAAERDAGFQVASIRPVDAAAHLTVPLLVVAGADDRLAPPGDATAIARAAGGLARLIIVEGADHQGVLPRCADSCEAALVDLLERAGFTRAKQVESR